MAKFKKGHSGNPGGRPKLPKDVRDASQLGHVEFVRLANRFMNLKIKDLKVLYESMDLSTKEMMMASVLYMTCKFGDPKRFDFILNRLIGKVKEQLVHSLATPTIIERRDGTQVILGDSKDYQNE